MARVGLRMNRSSPRYNRRGFTLVELLVTITVLALILTAICDTYLMIQTEWSRQQGLEDTRIAARQAISGVAAYMKVAHSANVMTRFTPNDTLQFYLPLDMAYGIYVPQKVSNMYRADAITPYYFYLSDSTGSFTRSGNILWAGYWSMGSVVGDPSWSLYPGTTKGRIAPVQSLSFSVDTTGFRPRVTTTVTTSCTINGTPEQFILSAVTSLRNCDD